MQGGKKFFFSFLLSVFLLFGAVFAYPAFAASGSLYLAPSAGTYVVNNKFSVSVKINSGGVSVNAAEASLRFDKSFLKVTGISKGSIFNLWTQEPSFSNSDGTISFGGGIPRPGYTGSGGTICTITFQALKVGTAQVAFNSGSVLANDGMGTNILASMGNGSYVISAKVEPPKGESGETKPSEPEEAAYNVPEISSKTHPDQNKWYKEARIEFSWKLPANAVGVSLAFDQDAAGQPGPVSDGLFDSKFYTAESDGSWYLHAKVKDEKGRWGTTGNFRVNIDSAPPQINSLEIKQADENDWPSLYIDAIDRLSGIDHYELIIDDLKAAPIIISGEEKSYKLKDLEIGDHSLALKAVDLAGNEAILSKDFEITAVAAPLITDYSREISPRDKFFVSGTAGAGYSINVYIQGESDALPIITTVKSDGNGNWFFISPNSFAKGRYTVWAEAVNANGLKSKPSIKVSFLVTPPIFTQIGSFVVDYFTVFVSLIFMVLLIILLAILIFNLARKKLKKETLEIEEVLEKNMKALKEEVNEEISELGGKLNKTEVKKQLNEKIDETNRKILKEIRDVEKILK